MEVRPPGTVDLYSALFLRAPRGPRVGRRGRRGGLPGSFPETPLDPIYLLHSLLRARPCCAHDEVSPLGWRGLQQWPPGPLLSFLND